MAWGFSSLTGSWGVKVRRRERWRCHRLIQAQPECSALALTQLKEESEVLTLVRALEHRHASTAPNPVPAPNTQC